MSKYDWMHRAACADPGIDPAIFHSDDHADLRDAREICASCPVSIPCMELRRATGDRHGIRAGYWAGVECAGCGEETRDRTGVCKPCQAEPVAAGAR